MSLQAQRLWLCGSVALCLYRADSFHGTLSAPPPRSQAAPATHGQTLWHSAAGLWTGAAFSETNERDSVFLPKTARSCQLYVCRFTRLLKDITMKFHSKINSAPADLCPGWTNLIYQTFIFLPCGDAPLPLVTHSTALSLSSLVGLYVDTDLVLFFSKQKSWSTGSVLQRPVTCTYGPGKSTRVGPVCRRQLARTCKGCFVQEWELNLVCIIVLLDCKLPLLLPDMPFVCAFRCVSLSPK